MSFRTGIFWLLSAMIWLLATPAIANIIDAQALTGVEGFLVTIFPWVVLLALAGKVIAEFRGTEA